MSQIDKINPISVGYFESLIYKERAKGNKITISSHTFATKLKTNTKKFCEQMSFSITFIIRKFQKTQRLEIYNQMCAKG